MLFTVTLTKNYNLLQTEKQDFMLQYVCMYDTYVQYLYNYDCQALSLVYRHYLRK